MCPPGACCLADSENLSGQQRSAGVTLVVRAVWEYPALVHLLPIDEQHHESPANGPVRCEGASSMQNKEQAQLVEALLRAQAARHGPRNAAPQGCHVQDGAACPAPAEAARFAAAAFLLRDPTSLE